MDSEFNQEITAALTQWAGTPPSDITSLKGGRNNRVYRVRLGQNTVAVKIYFRDRADSHDRLRREFDFASFAWAGGLRSLPRPLFCSDEAGLSVFEFIEGRLLQPNEIDDPRVSEAITFYRQLNDQRRPQETRALSQASEACFSLAEHLDLVDKRVERLRQWEPMEPTDTTAAEFIHTRLCPTWQDLRARVASGIDPQEMQEPLKPEDRCLSPSDFGFHNAILAADQKLRFIDFEHAGWDDPAKSIVDFFCQPQLPVPKSHYSRLAEAFASLTRSPERTLARARRLQAVYRVKWSCIALNDFLPDGRNRRDFAQRDTPLAERKARQLAVAQNFIHSIDRILHHE